MLVDQLKADLTQSLKKGDTVRVGTLRFLLSAVQNAAIAKYGALGEAGLKDADVLDVIKNQAKTHRESIDAFEKAERMELVAKEQAELTILEALLPKQLSDDELTKLLEPVITSGEKNTSTSSGQVFGLLMKQAMAAVKGQADGGRVAELLKYMLQKSITE